MNVSPDGIRVTGLVRLELVGPDGLAAHREAVNLVTTVGKGVVANRMQAAPTKVPMSYAAFGSFSTPPSLLDTALGNEVAGTRMPLTTVVTGNLIVYTASMPPGVGSGTLTETGLFNDAVAGDMLARVVFLAVDKFDDQTLNLTWDVTIG